MNKDIDSETNSNDEPQVDAPVPEIAESFSRPTGDWHRSGGGLRMNDDGIAVQHHKAVN